MKQAPMFGQWIGRFAVHSSATPSGAYIFTPGSATFNIEYDQPNVGFACVDQGNQIHGSRKTFNLRVEGNRFSGYATSTIAFDWEKNEPITIEESTRRQKEKGLDVSYSNDVSLDNGFIDQNTLKCDLSARLQGGTVTGYFEGRKLCQAAPSVSTELMSWERFKTFIAEQIQNGREFLFRGQASNRHRLTTSFHREHRYDLIRYHREACQKLIQYINAFSSRQYDLKNPIDFAALLSLAQHHGFPTPLLDWSKSPYIAAFFAFESRSIFDVESVNPRIYIFDAKTWRQDTTQALNIADPRPTITPIECPIYNNPRHLPQQSVHTFTNIEDMEEWIKFVEQEKNKRYLTIIDISASERELAMRDLAYMGVTAATLFPGLDGICRSLKEEFFSRRLSV